MSTILLALIGALVVCEIALIVYYYFFTSKTLVIPRRVAAAAAGVTFFLLLLGGLVHNTRSSLACPDWPLCYGSAVPKMEGGVLVEHGHRLLATTVGTLTVTLAVLLARHGRRRMLLGLGAVGLVVLQGVLGGITVIYRLPTAVSTSHLAVSLLFFLTMIFIAFDLRDEKSFAPLPVSRTWIALSLVGVYLQCLLGALMRHLGVGLACVDLPLCRGSIWPRDVHPSVSLHVLHRLVAVAVGLLVCFTAALILRARAPKLHKRLALALPLLVLTQIALGALSIVTFLDAAIVTAHLGGAALILADLASLLLLTPRAVAETPPVTVGEGVTA